ncbi:carbohydrate-binding protein [Halomonas sp. SpR1]|uniref:carbohydrate-binding protein n=1 Tax=Halomonas sp. SpR1 TaxID=3050462 RepID=UPI0027E42AB4|nr:carbohydrate-binding protein [Halomonas sp. SpR1]MDQ7734296.1 carbohydrate-binding protein [Halomonas sp. SpR1]
MFSMSFVSGQAKSLLGTVHEGGRWGRDTFHDHQLHVVPHPSPWESSIKAIRLAWEDARNEISVFESFERPFVFENLPMPALGRLKMRIEAMDESGSVLPNSSMTIDLDVVPESDTSQETLPESREEASLETKSAALVDDPVLPQADDGFAVQAVIADTFTPIRIQAEDADDSDGVSAVIAGSGINVVDDPLSQPNAVNADGQAYVDYGDGVNGGETLTFTFSVEEAGEYELALGYALSQNDDGTDRNRPLRLDVNDQLVDRMFDLPSTTLTSTSTDFSDYGERTIRVLLEAGENTVIFTSNGASGPNVDYLEVRAPDPDVYVVQAEDLVLSPLADNENGATNRVVTVDNIADLTDGLETFRVGAEGASYLDWAFNNANAYGEFTLDVATSGTYSVTVTYATSTARPLDLSLVDEGGVTQVGTFNFTPTAEPNYYPDDVSDVPTANQPAGPGGNNPTRQTEWEGWSTETIEISLAGGSNTLRLGGAANGPNIDKLEVALVAADPVDPTTPVIDAIVMQAEDADLGAGNDAGTLVRDAENPESGTSFQGLRPDYSGTGYVDYGSAPGDSLTFTVNVAEAGSYDLNFRYASSGDRPMSLAVNGSPLAQQAFASTDPNATNEAPEGFDVWAYQSLTTELVAGDNTIVLSIPEGAGSGPNLDRLEVTTAGTGPVGDVQADADETPLVFSADNSLINGAAVGEAGFSVTGLDEDIASVGISFDGGVTVEEVTPNTDGSFTLDLSGRGDGDLTATLIAMDAFGNRVEQSIDLTLDTTADEGDDLALEGPGAEIATGDSDAVVFGVAGIDADSILEVSFDGGETRQTASSDGDSLTVDLSGQGPGDVTVTLIVTDAAGNEATVQDTVTLAAAPGPVAIDVSFDNATISAYNDTQDNPASGTGATVEDDGATLSLTDNVWKRAELPSSYTITGQTLLTLDVAISDAPVPEIVAIGFDADENPFNGGNSVYQLGGTQTQGGFVDLRGQGVDNGDGSFRFTIDLSAHAGITIDSLVFVNDDDLGAKGSTSFSAVSLSEEEAGETNSAPRVVGGGIADLSLDEGANIEVDLPFVDDDGDALSYSFVVTDSDGQEISMDGLSVDSQVLSGSLEGLAPGNYTVSVTADDGTASTSTDFTLTVENVNDAPAAEPVALEPYFGEVGESFIQIPLADFATLFSDPDGDTLTLSAEDLPAGLEVVDGIIQGIPSLGGSFDVVIRATDPSGLSATQTLSFVIEGTQVGDAITIEAENFTDLDAANLIVTGSASASNEQLIRLTSNEPATIGTDLAAGGVEPGWYVARLYVFDENDGEGALTLTIGDTVLQARNSASDSLSSDVVLNDNFGTIVGSGPRGNAGQSGNRKEIVFETPFEVTAGDLASLELRGAGGEQMRIDSLTFERIDEPVNSAPTLEGLSTDVSVDENSSAVANLVIDDADGDSLTVTLSGADAALFSFDQATGELAFINQPDAELAADSNEDGVYELTVTVSDGEDSVSQDTLITVADINESIVIDQTTYSIDENLTEIGAIPVVDEDGASTGLNAPVFAITGGIDAPLFIIDEATGVLSFTSARDFELAVDDDEDGVYEVEVTVTDGDLTDVQTLEVTVNDVDEAPFTPLSLQIQDGTVTSFDDDANATDTTVRNAGNPEDNPDLENGLRPDFSGTGYLDFGDTAGDNVTWQVDVAQAGQYDISVRYATNSDRPLDLVINGGTPVVLDMLATDPDGTGPVEGFDNWLFETVTVTLEAGSNSIELAIPEGATTGPNIDRIEITEGGTGPIPVDDSADEDGNLTLTAAEATLEPDQLATALFNVAGADADIVMYEVSFDGGTTRTEVTPEENGDITVDLSGQSGDVTVTLIVTDAVGNEAQANESVIIGDGNVVVEPFTVQGEDAIVTDVGGTAQGAVTRVVDADNPDDFGNFREGAVGDAYLDFGTDAGDQITFNIDAPAAGTYTATIRYANGGAAPRPLDLAVNGTAQPQVPFVNAADDGVNDPWDEWLEQEVEVTLDEGANTFTLTIPTAPNGGVGNGPNIDQITFDYQQDDGSEPPAEPFLFEIQGEALSIDDDEPTPDTVVRDADNPETNEAAGPDGLWDGYTGTGYLDMGGEAGDAAFFDVSVEEAGTYTLSVRYTNGGGDGADRPMNILVGGESQGEMAFPLTGEGNAGWLNWQEATIEVELEAGSNTIRLENVGNAGPNIDSLSVTRDAVEPPDVVEPVDRFSVKINFQPEDVAIPEGYIADNGKAFGTQSVTIDGQTYQYGWVTEASIYDDEPGTIPLDISSLTNVAVNDRTDDIAGLDPRQGTYAHFDQPGSQYVRAGWEIELEDGYYEVTISIGDTSGPYDSRNVLNAEGELFNDPFTPFRPDDFPADSNPGDDTEGVRSDLVTRIVQVSDGRLTLDSLGLDNENTEIQYIEIQSLPDLTPEDDREAPQDYAFFTDARAIAGVGENEVEVDLDGEDGAVPTGVDPTSDIFVGISVVDGRGGALLESLNDGSVKLFETVTGEEVSFNVNTTGGFDSLTISPSQMLKPFTSYTLVIDGFQDRGPNDDADAPTREFQKYTNTFVTGEEPEVVARDVAFNDVVELNGAADNAYGFTSLEMSPDGAFMYIATIGGDLLRYNVDPVDGSLSNRQDLSLPSDYFDQPGESQQRGIIGLTVDPTDPNVLWITDNYPIPLNGRDNGVPEFSGRITKITLDGGNEFSGTAEPYITGLPRSNGDHVTNSLEFRANPDYDAATNPDVPTHLLYLIQGSNSAMGEPDSAWGNRPERLLNASVMEIDPTRDAPPGGFDVSTEPVPDNGQNTRFNDPDGHPKDDPIPMGNGEFLVFDERGVATVQDADGTVLQSYYDPFAEGAVLTLFATGARNAYDLVWHSNGFLYVPTNGSAAGGNVPDDPSTPENERYTNVEKQDDYLFKVVEGGYYGHPNPLRDEYIMNGGNPTGGTDPNQVDSYPTGTNPEGSYDISGVYSLGENRSPNGAVEYTSGIFGGNLQGNLLFTEYSGGDDVRSITLDANGNVIGDDVLRDPEGNVISYVDPLDIIENPVTGQLYLLTLNRGNGQSQIIRLDPAPGGVVDPVDPDPGDDLVSLLVIQAEDNTPNDGTSVTLADAEIQIRDLNNPETTAGLPNGLRPGAFGLDGNTNDNDGVPGGYADFGATNADFLTFSFNLNADQAGESVLRLRYANGGTADRPLEVFVNNVSVGVFDFSPPPGLTGDAAWAEWLTEDVAASLVVGENTVRLQSTDNTGPNIDQLEVLQSPPDTTPGFTEYEAESALLDGPVVVPESADDRNASGEGYVDFDGTGDQTITWTVDVNETGNYEIGFRYALAASKADRPMEVTINGVNLGLVNFVGQSNEAENDWFFQELLVNLQAGSNTISVTAPEANGPNVDLLRVPDAPTDTFMPVYADVSDGARIELESGDNARAINDLTADFYFTVDADGLYRLDLAANAGANDGQGLTLTLNGQPVDVLAYPGQGDAGEEGTYVELEAGVEYNLRVVSTADGADELDYLDVTPVSGNDNADIAIQSGDAAYYSDRLHFSYLENNSASNPDRDFKESATVTISNTGSEALEILDADIDGPFVLQDPSIFEGLTLAAGESLEVTVLFDRDSYTPPTNDAGDGVFEGRIRLTTNDADSPIAEIYMAGFWQARDEGGWEPNVNEVWEVFGFGNRIDGLTTVGGGENSVLNDFDLYRPVNDDEVLSRYWTLADGAGEAKITQLAAYHGGGGATLGIHNPGNKGQDIIFSNHAGDNNQSLLPVKSDGQFATANFSLADIPSGWTGQGVFGIEVANLSTDPSLNPEGGGTPPADAEGIERGYTVRMFRALDAEGNVIPNTYLGVMDYTGINYDYNDNMFLIEGVTPVAGGELTVINNDGVPSNDRLVMSRIENPANAAQEVHDEATITIRNDGFETLDINSIEVSDTTLFELTEAFAAISLEPGESIDVTVRFIADDPNDASLYEASLVINSSDADEGEKVIQLAGLAQNQSESGQEPLVQEIINAFGYTTNVAEGQMNQGGLVEANGDEILSPYFQRADGSSPIKITQLAAYHTQGDVARLFIHDVDSRDLDEILAHDEADGQTLLPRTLNNGDLLTTTTLDRDAPFGFFAEISGRQGYISWSDPDANLYEDTIDAIGNPGTNLNWDENDGHLIRVYIAKDAAGNVIPDTYIVIQDYAGVNYDYNDNIFLVENVQTYDPTGAEDADGNGRVDLYDDDDNDGVPNFIDNPEPVGQTAFNAGETAWAVGNDGLTLEAKLYDNGGQGVAYNDTTAAHQGAAFRADEAVDISNGTEALGYIADGEWVEYTLNVETAGTYTLSFSTSAVTDGKTITAAFEQGGGFYTPAQVQNLPNTGSFTSFQTVGPLTFELEEGEQVLRLTFNGGQLDLASFTLDFEAPLNDGQSAFNDTQTAWEVGAEGLSLEARFYDNGGQDVAYNDTTAAHQGDAFRSDEAVDISTPSQAIGFIEDGEWVEYTINVAEDGVYDLDFLTSMASSNPAARSITASFAKGDTPYVTASSVGVSPTGSWTSFTQTDTTQVTLEAGEQVLRLTFNGGPMDLASFNLVPVDQTPVNQAPEVEAGIDDITMVEGEAINFSLPEDAFVDDDGDSLTYTASGLPSGISMSTEGVFSGTATSAGSFDIIVTASDGQDSVQAAFTLAVEEAPVVDGQQAFTDDGNPWQVGSDFTLDAVNYDEGGQNVAYNDAEADQIGSDFRPGDGVDIVGDGDAIGWVDEGEWVEYTLNIQQAGVYDLSFLSALGDSSGAQRSITATFTKGDGTPYASIDPVVISPTGGWGNFQPTDATQVALETGEQVLRLTFNGGSQDLASFSLARDGQQAFNAGGTPWLVDADEGLTLNAALFDEGGQEVAYNDADAVQIGSDFRPDEGVDIVGQGEAIGWVDEGEWVEYTINVEQAGSHTLSFVTSSPNNGRTISAAVEQDGVFYEQSAPASVPNSGAWGTYLDGPSLTLDLEEGVQVLRLTFNGGSQDLASFQISRDPDVNAASVLNMDMMNMASDMNDGSSMEEELVAMSDDVSISGVQENDQGVLM